MKRLMSCLILLYCVVSEVGLAFNHKMKCRVNEVTGKLLVIGENASKKGKIRVGDLAFFDTSLKQMYLHPGHKLIRFENYKGEIAQIYSCTTIEKETDTEDLTFYDDDGYEGMSLLVQRVPETGDYVGFVESKRTDYEGIVRLECVISSETAHDNENNR